MGHQTTGAPCLTGGVHPPLEPSENHTASGAPLPPLPHCRPMASSYWSPLITAIPTPHSHHTLCLLGIHPTHASSQVQSGDVEARWRPVARHKNAGHVSCLDWRMLRRKELPDKRVQKQDCSRSCAKNRLSSNLRFMHTSETLQDTSHFNFTGMRKN